MNNLTLNELENINGGKSTGWQAVIDGVGGAIFLTGGIMAAGVGAYPFAADAFSNAAMSWNSLFE